MMIACQICDKPFSVKPYRAHTAKFCSLKCRGMALIGKKPINTGIYTARIILICNYCKQEFEQIKSRLNHGRGKYCSTVCQYASIKELPRQADFTEYTCLCCGGLFSIYSSSTKINKGVGKYCSRTCRDNHRHGVNHPQYINGGNDNRGPNWTAQRRKALKRDNFTCQYCHNPGSSVHHIKPFRLFGMERYKEANDINNLITLCDKCHRRADAEIQRIENNKGHK